MRRLAWALLGFATAAGAAQPQRTVALFSELQDAPPFSSDEMAARQKEVDPKDEGAAADLALNNWKNCVIESLTRWAPLKQGPGTLIDGAYGRCADAERDYRGHLMRITQDGRQVVDVYEESLLETGPLDLGSLDGSVTERRHRPRDPACTGRARVVP